MILHYAIKANASSIIICHNHPSGNVQPSESDLTITRKIKESGNVMDIQLLDHLIIIPEGKYYSMADEGTI
jgi:DNA repair protein RadC